MKLLDTIYESVLLEYSYKLIDLLVDRFSEEGVDPEEAREYINLFHRFSQGLDPDKRDITKYSWDELYRTVNDQKDSRRIKAWKIGNKNVDKDDVIYLCEKNNYDDVDGLLKYVIKKRTTLTMIKLRTVGVKFLNIFLFFKSPIN